MRFIENNFDLILDIAGPIVIALAAILSVT
jgi:hypothetical protein